MLHTDLHLLLSYFSNSVFSTLIGTCAPIFDCCLEATHFLCFPHKLFAFFSPWNHRFKVMLESLQNPNADEADSHTFSCDLWRVYHRQDGLAVLMRRMLSPLVTVKCIMYLSKLIRIYDVTVGSHSAATERHETGKPRCLQVGLVRLTCQKSPLGAVLLRRSYL